MAEPSVVTRCPYCGERLFRQCRCGQVIERCHPQCPHCGFDWTVFHRSVRRPPIRLWRLLGVGLLGALIGTLMGMFLLLVVTPWLLITPSQPVHDQSGNFLTLTLKGLLLLLSDIGRTTVITFQRHPLFLSFPVSGFVIATFMGARRQRFSVSRLKRHLRRRWKRLKEQLSLNGSDD